MLTFLKVSEFVFVISAVSDVIPDIRGSLRLGLRGEGNVKGSLGFAPCEFCRHKQLPVSTVSRASMNHRGLQPIVTEGLPWMGSIRWKYLTGCLPIHSSVDTSLVVCTERPNFPVRCDALTYLTASTNIDTAPGPLATNV